MGARGVLDGGTLSQVTKGQDFWMHGKSMEYFPTAVFLPMDWRCAEVRSARFPSGFYRTDKCWPKYREQKCPPSRGCRDRHFAGSIRTQSLWCDFALLITIRVCGDHDPRLTRTRAARRI